MSKSKNIFIQHLDIGYVLSVDGKDRAITDSERLHETLQSLFRVMTDRASQQGIINFSISIEVDENVPRIAK